MYNESSSFSEFAFHADVAVMLADNLVDIGQAQAEAFDIVHIAR